VDIRPGLMNVLASRASEVVMFEHTSSRYVDSMLNVLLPSGRADVGFPKRDE
jgi:hypothetical protein